ncbi:MAG: hypothetical protein WKF94_02050 [Solirubrobacteraceae bacterium]
MQTIRRSRLPSECSNPAHGPARRPLRRGCAITVWPASQHGGDFDGGLLVSDALGVAQELAAGASATVVALDPYDEATDAMWRERFKMRPSRTLVRCGDGVERRRLFLPLRRP